MDTTTPRRVALVTGASSGIGRALAACFARDGVDLVLVARRGAELEELGRELSAKHGVRVASFAADLARLDDVERVVADVRAAGLAPDFLVNNAGYGVFGLFEQTPLDEELAMIALNMTALTVLTKRFLPDLVAKRGRLMNVASTAAFQPGPYMAVYYATKAYVLSLSEALAEELAPTGVTVTGFCPGPTASGFQDRAVMKKSRLVRGKRLPSSEEVAEEGYRAMLAGRRVYIPGALNWAMAQSVRFTPRRVVTALVKHLSRPA